MNNPCTALRLRLRKSLAGSLALLALSFSIVNAQTNTVGEIQGRVFNVSNGSYLDNARIVVKGTAIEAFTNSSGEYLLHGLPSGDATIVVTYTGLVAQSATVRVEAGRTVLQNFELEPAQTIPTDADKVVVLDKLSVIGKRMNAQSLALNEQRNAASIRNVVTAGEFGDNGEGNAYELIKYLPGVNVDSSTAGQGVSIRGFPSTGTLVTIDGGEVASAATYGAGRNIELDAIRLNNISRIEITKVPTPDLPANAQGGAINAVSKSGFERRTPLFSYRAYTSFNSRGFIGNSLGKRGSRAELNKRPVQPGFNLSYEWPINKSLAFNFSASNNLRSALIGEIQMVWDLNKLMLKQVDTNPGENMIDSHDVAFGADWRIGNYNLLRINYLYNKSVVYRAEHRQAVLFGAGATGGADSIVGAPAGVDTAVLYGTAAKIARHTSQLTLNHTYNPGVWKIKLNASLGRSWNRGSDFDNGYAGFTQSVLSGLRITGTGLFTVTSRIGQPRELTAVNRSGVMVDLFDPGAYSLAATQRYLDVRVVDTKNSAKADIVREFGDGLSLQAGVALSRQERDVRRNFEQYNFSRPPGGINTVRNYDLQDPEYAALAKRAYPGHPVPLLSATKVYNLLQQHPEYFVLNPNYVSQNVAFSKYFSETISAAYLRVDMKRFDNRLWLVGGVRFEHTADEGEGPLYDKNGFYARDPNGMLSRTSTGALIPLTNDPLERQKLQLQERGAQASKSYSGFYPSLNATYRFTDDLLLRAGYARTIGRPNLTEIVPFTTLPDINLADAGTDRILRVVNAGLRPWTSDGLDIAFESYNVKGGVGSIGVFAKRIQDFFGATQTAATPALLEELNIHEEFEGQYAGYDILTKENTGTARIKGMEFNYRQSLYFLPSWGKNLQVYGNATVLSLSGPKTSDFTNFVPNIYNYGVNFAARKFSVRLNWNIRGRARQALVAASSLVPAMTYNYLAPRTTVSADFEYRITKWLSFSGTVYNLTDTPIIFQQYNPDTPAFARTNRLMLPGAEFTLGIKGSF